MIVILPIFKDLQNLRNDWQVEELENSIPQ